MGAAVVAGGSGDAGEGQQDLLRSAERLADRCAVYGDKASLGRLFGRELLAVLAITDRAIADAVRAALRCVAELGEARDFGLASEGS